jgi:hypothetical protein
VVLTHERVGANVAMMRLGRPTQLAMHGSSQGGIIASADNRGCVDIAGFQE